MFGKGVLREHSAALNGILRLLDVAILVLAGLIAHYIIFNGLKMTSPYKVGLLTAALTVPVFFPVFAMYRVWRGYSRAEEFRAVVISVTGVFMGLIILGYISEVIDQIDRRWMGLWYVLAMVLLIVERMTLRNLLRIFRSQGYNQRRVVIFGEGELGLHMLERIHRSPFLGMQLVGYFSDGPNDYARARARLVGSTNMGVKLLKRFQKVDQILIAMPMSQANKLQELLDRLQDVPVSIRFIPDIFGFSLINHGVSTIAGMPAINISVSPMEGVNRLVKAVEDKILAAMILLMISPIILALAIGVRFSSPGPIFFRQERVSWNGKRFYMYKFRSMPVDVETKSGAVWAKAGEQRATPFGAFLRKTSLDELPQFWNVLKGDMSIVGPRPERPVFVNKFKDEVPGYMQKHMVKAGITGWAQVCGWRGDTDIGKRIECDLYYIENWSLWFDIKIIVLTLFRGFVNKNAY
ncbi:undecaprenyl-phosphate glucose phosphotransferase [Halioxenophilus sp. WMMB6]|uniref:undecaprenyl-phosphate glucose phosphotransferase n=1 Tax=Halioxenophilus sp. WMMB6 TaxID=3073815 RepID=UPI00295F0D23|nr:undecaprenyl-phosphate glucose phosphotransferase [Halioxenophilus sp. WMMB6]